MTIRPLLYGMCLLAGGLTAAHSQGVAPGPNSAPTDKPAIDGTAKTPDSVGNPPPEVIKQPGSNGDVIQPKTTEDPSAVLNPPNVDPKMQVQGSATTGEEKRADRKQAVPK